MTRRQASFRLQPEALDLLAAWAAHNNTSQSRTIERLLQRQEPPTAAGPTESAIRRAHTALLSSRTRETP